MLAETTVAGNRFAIRSPLAVAPGSFTSDGARTEAPDEGPRSVSGDTVTRRDARRKAARDILYSGMSRVYRSSPEFKEEDQMPDFDEKQYVHAHDQFFQGDLDPAREVTAEDYVLHLPVFDVHVSDREKAFDWLRQFIQQANVRQRVLKVELHGDFLVTHVSGSSDLRGDYEGVDVARLDEDRRVVEVFMHRSPLPPGTDLPTG